jgi:hypothetical protein
MSEQERIVSEALDQFSDGELEAEVKRREKIRNAPPAPLPNDEVDWEPVANLALDYINIIERNARAGDIKQYIFEAVITAVYGNDVWEWINKRLQ